MNLLFLLFIFRHHFNELPLTLQILHCLNFSFVPFYCDILFIYQNIRVSFSSVRVPSVLFFISSVNAKLSTILGLFLQIFCFYFGIICFVSFLFFLFYLFPLFSEPMSLFSKPIIFLPNFSFSFFFLNGLRIFLF